MSVVVKNSIAAMVPELTALRRDFHRYPELLYDVPRTAGIVADQLRACGFDEVIEGVGQTGVLGILHGATAAAGPEQRVLFRADMDALPIHEAGSAEYASTIPGHMHACGHDGHTVMLLGAARHLAGTRDFAGTLVFCFQPAEEGGAGAQAMIDAGMLERFPVKGAYAVHNWPGMPVGHFGVVRGAAMAAAGGCFITIEGVGGHASQPESTRDPIVTAGYLITAVQTIVSRVIAPSDQAVVSITSIHGGDAFNVIPNKVEMKCNIRSFSESVSATIDAELARMCEHIGATFGTKVTLHHPPNRPYPPTVNHPAETELALVAMRAVAGEAQVDDTVKPVMGSEDFSFILRQVPGAYIFIGNGDSAGLHNPAYDFNDAAIPHGIAYWTALARVVLPV